MSQLVIPASAAALGYWIGGPTGAAIGWSIGSAQSNEENDTQQDLGDLTVQTSQYGVGIPLVSGKQRVTGNIIWSTDKKPYEKTEGGKGGGPEVTSTGFRISIAIALCQGPILGVSRVWEQGKLTADASSGQTKLPGTLYLGSNIQTADPVMEAVEGVGNVPGYRGLAYVVLDDFDLGVTGAIPQFSFEVVKGVAL